MFLSAILSNIHGWYRHRETVRQLSVLTDRELSDIGLSRDDIARVVRQGR